jgi:hypothetical protein
MSDKVKLGGQQFEEISSWVADIYTWFRRCVAFNQLANGGQYN